MTNFIWFLTFPGVVFKWKVVMVYSSSSGVLDHKKDVTKHSSICHGTIFSRRICPLGTEVAKVRPAKIIQEKFLCENDRLSRTFNREILKLLKIILDT